MSSPWYGVFPALWTPAGAKGELQADALAEQARFLRGAGVDGLMVLGSTGEFLHFTASERRAIVAAVAGAVPGFPLIVNISEIRPRTVAELGRHARAVGAALVAVLPPYFFEVVQADLIEFFVRAGEAAGLPLMLYNFPERTGHHLALETIATVADRVPVAAVKQSGGEFSYHARLSDLGAEKGFTVLTGSDTRIGDAFVLGSRGVVSGLANAVPELVVEVTRAALDGDVARAANAQACLTDLAACLAPLKFPLDVAAAMRARGRPTGEPKPVLSAETVGQFRAAVDTAREVLRAAEIL